jgi:hypothetical protein
MIYFWISLVTFVQSAPMQNSLEPMLMTSFNARLTRIQSSISLHKNTLGHSAASDSTHSLLKLSLIPNFQEIINHYLDTDPAEGFFQ